QSKSLLIAIAAFAVTATGVHAYGGPNILSRAGLSEKQVIAIQEAQQLKATGNDTAARDRLAEAGITEETLKSIHRAAKAVKVEMREALKDGDYEAFKKAVADGPLSDVVVSEDDFKKFRQAHDLRLNGEWAEAADILEELGVDVDKKHFYQKGLKKGFMSHLSEDQRSALQVAKQANDRATMQAIMDEAGLDFGHRFGHRGE
ncbi:hypothetical protein KC872_03075, partial [Candidatus Kaiserbacteria bacterium]|nr:hypothetical protein [Candidatus Kaiserbacteria bacterium]